MYKEDEFYSILDDLRFDMYYASYKNIMYNYERVLIKVFKLLDEMVIVETINGKDKIIFDNRLDKNKDLLEYDLVFLKVLDRFTCDEEISGRIYEKIAGIGCWSRVKIEGYNPNEAELNVFFEKSSNQSALNDYQKKFDEIVKGERFSKKEEVMKILNKIIAG